MFDKLIRFFNIKKNVTQESNLNDKKIVYYSTDKQRYVIADIPTHMSIQNNVREIKQDIYGDILEEFKENEYEYSTTNSKTKIISKDNTISENYEYIRSVKYITGDYISTHFKYDDKNSVYIYSTLGHNFPS